MQYYFFILVAVCLLALQFSTNRSYGIRRGTAARASLFFTTMTGLLSAAVSLLIAVVTKETISFTPYSIVMAILVAAFCCFYTFIGFKIMALGSLSVYSMFLMLGGMLCPYIVGVIWLEEPISVARVIGVILLIASMVFPVVARKNTGKAGVLFLLLCAAVFLLNGGVSVVSKLHQIETVRATSPTASFSIMTNMFNGLLSALLYLYFTLTEKKKSPEEGDYGVKTASGRGAIVCLIVANAACNGVSYMLQLASAGKVPASVMYPMMTGGSVVLTALAGRIFFGEKPDKISLVGIILAFAATFLFLF